MASLIIYLLCSVCYTHLPFQSTHPLREWILSFVLEPNLQGALSTAPFIHEDDDDDDDDDSSGDDDGSGEWLAMVRETKEKRKRKRMERKERGGKRGRRKR